MNNIHRVTYALAALVFVTAVFSIATRGNGNNPTAPPQAVGGQQSQTTEMQRHLAANKAYPIVDYDEAEPSDPSMRASRSAKQKRYNNFGMVMKTPHPDDAEISFIAEGAFDFQGLPVDKSEVIVVGDVITGEAHLSENKRNIFSEFTVKISTVLKTLTPTGPTPDSQITIERVGGYVRYPNRQTVLYRGAGYGMPRVGGRYVFFLRPIAQSNDYSVLTGYELGEKGIEPLDFSAQFEAFRGFDVPTFMSTLDEVLSKSSPR